MLKDYSTKKQNIIIHAVFVFMTALVTSALFSPAATATVSPAQSGHNNQVRWQYTSSWKGNSDILEMAHSLDGKHVFFLTKEKKVQIYTTGGKSLGTIPVAPQINHIDISPVGDTLYLFDSKKKEFSSISLTFQNTIDTSAAPAKGESNAPISIVIFTDFECPYCKKLPPVLEEVERNNRGMVRIFFKNMPLISIHKMAESAARAAIAAKNQDKFWPYHDKLFAAKELSSEKLLHFAKELGLDMEKFSTDMQTQETTNTLQKDMYDARNAGVEGTPTIFVNGWALGNRTVEGFQEMIDTLAAEKE